jgi:hypothetical protein
MATAIYWNPNRTATNGTTATWNQWVNVGYTTTATTGTGWQDDTWYTWANTTTNQVLVAYDPAYTWREWEDAGHPYAHEYVQRPAVWEPTQEELDAAQRRREEQSARLLAEKQRLAGAEDRAVELLRSLLTADQRQTMDADGEVWVKGSDGGYYVIETRDGRVHGNVRSVDEHGCMLGRLCVQPGMYDRDEGAALPTSDGYVGQLLAIRFNERQFRETANWSGRRACQQPDVPILRAA